MTMTSTCVYCGGPITQPRVATFYHPPGTLDQVLVRWVHSESMAALCPDGASTLASPFENTDGTSYGQPITPSKLAQGGIVPPGQITIAGEALDAGVPRRMIRDQPQA